MRNWSELLKKNLSNIVLIGIIIVLLTRISCNNNPSEVRYIELEPDTITTTEIKYVDRWHTRLVEVPKEIISPPDTVYIDSTKQLQYIGEVEQDSFKMYYKINLSDGVIDHMKFKIKLNVPELHKETIQTINQPYLIKPRVTFYSGIAGGYSIRTQSPLIEVYLGLKDKKSRLWFLSFETFEQQVKFGVLIPLTN